MDVERLSPACQAGADLLSCELAAPAAQKARKVRRTAPSNTGAAEYDELQQGVNLEVFPRLESDHQRSDCHLESTSGIARYGARHQGHAGRRKE